MLSVKSLSGFALSVLCAYTGFAVAQTAATADTSSAISNYPDGVIEFFNEPSSGDGDGVLKCTLAFVGGTYSFKDGDNACKGKWDDVTRVKVIGIPSASTFTLYDDESCSDRDDQAYIYTLKSVKNPTTTDKSIPINTMGSTALGALLPNTTLRMEKKLRNRDERDLLGCVRIVRSAIPDNK